MAKQEVKLTKLMVDIMTSISSMFLVEKQIAITKNRIYAKGFGGSVAAIYNYDEESGNVVPEPFAIYNTVEFLGILDFMEPSTSKIGLDGDVVVVSDSVKQVKYLTCPLDLTPEPDNTVKGLFDDEETSKIRFVLGDADVDTILRSLSVMGIDEAYIQADDEGATSVLLYSTKTENSIKVPVKGKGIPGTKLKFPDPLAFKALYKGTYKSDIKLIEVNDMEFDIMKMTHMELSGKDGALEYTFVLQSEEG